MKLKFAIGTSALALAAIAAADERREDFAFSAPVRFDQGSALYQAPMSAEIYRRTVFADLRDLRVFNGDGEVVPYAVRQSQPAGAIRRSMVDVPIFPLYGDSAKALDALRVVVARNGASVQVDAPKGRDAGKPLVGYLVDLRDQNDSIVALDLSWNESMPQFATSVSIAASDDLSVWRALAHEAPIVNLQFAGQRLRESRSEFSATKAKFLRVTWPRGSQALDLRAIAVEPIATRPESNRLEAESLGSPGASGEFEFDLGMQAPIDRVAIRMPQINSVTPATIWSREGAVAQWNSIAQVTLYRVQHEGREVSNAPMNIAANTHRYWRITVDKQGFGSGVPRLQVAWVPAEVVFLARGAAPFALAVGSNMAKSAESPLSAIVGDESRSAGNRLTPAPATIGSFVEAGGVIKLNQPPPRNWKNWALWGVLLIGVALLAWMVRRLSREMNSQKT